MLLLQTQPRVHSHQLHLAVKFLNHRKKSPRCQEGGTAMQNLAPHSKQSKPKRCSPKQADQVCLGVKTDFSVFCKSKQIFPFDTCECAAWSSVSAHAACLCSCWGWRRHCLVCRKAQSAPAVTAPEPGMSTELCPHPFLGAKPPQHEAVERARSCQ